MPLCLPILLRPSQTNVIQAVAVIDNFAVQDSQLDRIQMDTQQFYTFMETAYIAREIQMRFTNIRNSVIWLSEGGKMFAHMFTRYLNKKYALNIDKRAHQKILYLAAKYFYINILQRKSSPMLDNYAIKAAKADDIDETTISRLDDEMAAHTN